MSRIVLHPTETAHWHSLVCEAEAVAQQYLDEELQSYVVFLLMRFLGKPEIASSIIALEYIKAMRSSGNTQQESLRDVGDICLLHAGFFPERARRRRVSRDYYIEMGSGAYRCLADAINHSLSQLYSRLSEEFLHVMGILRCIRELGDDTLSANLNVIENERAVPDDLTKLINPKRRH